MAEGARRRVTEEEWIDWSLRHPGVKTELVNGSIWTKNEGRRRIDPDVDDPTAMSPERSRHSRVKSSTAATLFNALRAAGRRCEVHSDGLSVVVGDNRYEPDVLVQCDKPTDPDSIYADEPTIIVEVMSPSTRAYDYNVKLGGYLTLPSVKHVLMIDPAERTVRCHSVALEDPLGYVRPLGPGDVLTLDPPGISVAVAALFGEED